VYAPVSRDQGYGWKEVQAGLCRIMQDYCGEFRSKETLGLGLEWLDSIARSEAGAICARNPHELMRSLEVDVRLEVGRAMMHASLARRASSESLGFKRIDFPEVDPPEWHKLIAMRQDEGQVLTRDLDCDYPLLAPYSPDAGQNYLEHCGL
jgi:succinate dehydrogenase/fumarate reductase flavoprotein subunit